MEKITITHPCPTDCGGCSCHINPPCAHCEWGHGGSNEVEVENLSQVSDGYHTIAELYDHRITLFIALCRLSHRAWHDDRGYPTWRTLKHSDGSGIDGWFMLGIGREAWEQITYHLPISRWDETDFAETLDQAPEFDGHTSADVLDRLKEL